MDKNLFRDYPEEQRKQMLRDNCDSMEEVSYMKSFTKEELQGHKEQLANLSIEINDLENELTEIKQEYKMRLKPLKNNRGEIVQNIKQKAKVVLESCYKFVDNDARETGYYNSDGDLILARPATADELQPKLFAVTMKTGTND